MKKVFIIIFLCFSSLVTAKPRVEHLRTGSFEQRIEAIDYFGRVKYKKVFWILVDYLNKDYSDKRLNEWSIKFRKHSAEALGRIGDKRAVEHLVKRFNVEKNTTVKQAIVYALSFYRHDSIADVVSNALLSKEDELQLEALHTAAELADKQFEKRIVEIKQSTRVYRKYLAACYTLVRIANNTEANYLQVKKGLLKKDPEYRFLAAYYLKKIGNIDSIEALTQALEIENYLWVRAGMNDALAYLKFIRKQKVKKQKWKYLQSR